MRPGRKNLEFTQGDLFTISVTFRDKVTKAALDYTGVIFQAQVRAIPASANVVETFAVNDSDAATGTIVFTLIPTQTRRLPVRCQWDAELLDGDGNPITILAGDVDVPRDVTRIEP